VHANGVSMGGGERSTKAGVPVESLLRSQGSVE